MINPGDQASIIRGAKFFAGNCMACHSMRYLRYDKLSKENGVVYDKMPLDPAMWTLGTPPPDLSLESRVRGNDWIYTYLQSFYVDKTQPTGYNNLLIPGSSMANVLAPLQGTQVLQEDMSRKALLNDPKWHHYLEITESGSMKPEAFKQTLLDVVNYLHYASEPHRAQRVHLGYWVMAFLVLLSFLSYLLKQEYWRDIHQ